LGVVIDGVTTGEEIALPSPPPRMVCTQQASFTVPYSYVDLNGHMNNTRFFDLAEDHIDAAAAGKALTAISVEYVNEARYGQELTVSWGQEGQQYYLTGEGDSCVFRMRLTYGE